MSTKICESCGMPMSKAEEFGGENISNKYCVHCTYPDGTLKSWQEKLSDTKNFIKSRMDLSDETALKMAEESLKKNPAWK